MRNRLTTTFASDRQRLGFLLLCLALVVIQIIWGVLNWITNYLFVKVGLQALLKLRTDLYSYLQSLSLKYHDARRSSDSSFRVAYDSQSIQTIYNKGFTNIFASVITLVGTFVVMVRIDWQLTLLSLGDRAPASSARFIFSRIGFGANRPLSRNRKARCSHRPRKGLSSIRMVHAFGREEWEVRQFQQQAQQSLQANLRLTLTNVNSALVISTLMVIGTAAMYYVGTMHVLAGTLTLGSLLVFSAYLLMLYQPLESLTYTAWAMEGRNRRRADVASRFWIGRMMWSMRQTRSRSVETKGALRVRKCFLRLRRRIERCCTISIFASRQTKSWRLVGGTGAGQEHATESGPAILRSHRWSRHARWPRLAPDHKEIAARANRHRPARHSALLDHRARKHRLRPARRDAKKKLSKPQGGRRPMNLFGRCLTVTPAWSANAAGI